MSTPLDAKGRFLRVLRWMEDNVSLVSSIWIEKATESLVFDPAVRVEGTIAVRNPGADMSAVDFQPKLNSGAALLICCYIDALGKVLTRGEKRSAVRFALFAENRLEGFRDDAKAHKELFPKWDNAPRVLYSGLRSGFVHSFASPTVGWTRAGKSGSYWTSCEHDGRRIPVLNVERLAEGFLASLRTLRADCEAGTLLEGATFDELCGFLDAPDPEEAPIPQAPPPAPGGGEVF